MGILEVVGLFLVRIGVPLLLLVALGHRIDRWQAANLDKHNQL